MLEVEKLNQYYGGSHILRDVSFDVPAGACTALMGRNGVGKTTLLKSIMGLLRPSAGRMAFGDGEGKDITRQAPYQRARAGIGYVPQGREIFPHLTVRENLQVGLMANPRKLRKVPDYIFDYFPALPPMFDRKGGVLSGGQQQLAIARVLAAEPKLRILDEPTEGIQPSIILLIGKVLERLKQEGKIAILLVEQYFEFALKLADRYYVMEKGAIVLNGAAAEMDKELVKPFLAL
jgi:urea transport system ATP-binding protein